MVIKFWWDFFQHLQFQSDICLLRWIHNLTELTFTRVAPVWLTSQLSWLELRRAPQVSSGVRQIKATLTFTRFYIACFFFIKRCFLSCFFGGHIRSKWTAIWSAFLWASCRAKRCYILPSSAIKSDDFTRFRLT